MNRDVSTLLPDVSFIREVRVNANGSQVAFLASDQSGAEDGRVYLYSPERQKVTVHDTRHALSRLTNQSDHDGTLSSTSFPRGSSSVSPASAATPSAMVFLRNDFPLFFVEKYWFWFYA